jgi:hypothetical protein
LVFSIVFAFAIGISTFNFGSLVRYKIPIYPFFLSMLFVLNYMKNPPPNNEVIDYNETVDTLKDEQNKSDAPHEYANAKAFLEYNVSD